MPQDQSAVNGREGKPRNYCGLPRRLLIMLYDGLVVIALMMFATALLLPFTSGSVVAGKDPAFTACLAAIWFLYLAWCWRHGGMTLGMRAWKVKLTSDYGSVPSWKQCSIRFAASLLSAALLGAGFISALFEGDRGTWHDRLSKTRLVRTRTS